jgi:superfamily I DNA and/or RNA helicase
VVQCKKVNDVAEIAKTLHKKGPFNSFDWCHGFFRAQVVLIRHLLRTFDRGGVTAGTIEDYQAVERDVIVVSLMRSNAAFVQNDVEHSKNGCLSTA